MKKILLATLLAATGMAAQAQLTISGSVEAGVKSTNANVTSIGGVKSDRNQITFAGNEDLGNGNAVNFTLQTRFDVGNGGSPQMNSTTVTSPQAFEQTAMGLTSKSLGSIRVGRFTNSLAANGLRYWVMEDSGYGAQDTYQYSRLSGTTEYTTPTVAGFRYTVTKALLSANKYITFVNGAGTTTTTDISASGNDLTAQSLVYDNGPLFAVYSKVSGFAGEASTRVAGAYKFNNGIKVGAAQFNQKEQWQTQTPHKNNYVGVEYATGKWVTAVSYSKADNKIAATHTGNAEKTGLKAYYSLTKRTTLETEVGKTKNTTAATDGTAYFVGVRHTF